MEVNTYYETDNKEILEAREQFKKLVKKYDEQIKEEKQKVIDAGGLKIIGTERHESRRIDNQLRGRSGRQGDVGESKFYIGQMRNKMWKRMLMWKMFVDIYLRKSGKILHIPIWHPVPEAGRTAPHCLVSCRSKMQQLQKRSHRTLIL